MQVLLYLICHAPNSIFSGTGAFYPSFGGVRRAFFVSKFQRKEENDMKKHWLSLALALALCLGLLPPPTASALSDFAINNGVLTAYHGEGGDVVIPNEVTAIGDSAFSRCQGLTSVTLPSGLTRIEAQAFLNCRNLVSITIPEGVTSLGDSAFKDCESLTSITVPSTVTEIGMSVFESCDSLTTAVLSPGVPYVGYAMFNSCRNLTSVTIPGSAAYIDQMAFNLCTSLTNVTLSKGIKTLGSEAFGGCTSLTALTLPDSVETIGSTALGSTGLTSLVLPNSVTAINNRAFTNCKNLTSVTIPASVQKIGNDIFERCGLLSDVYYGGTEAQWKEIQISSKNDILFRVNLHYSTAPAAPSTPSAPAGFTDVAADSPYRDAIAWAVEKGITKGTTATTFGPGQTCTVSHILTFLLRGLGENPDRETISAICQEFSSFLEIPNLTPDQPCTRILAVTLMAELMGDGSKASVSFTDVPASPSYYADAVAWAVAKGVTSGTSATTFSPNNICTRGQIVTFLYRLANA